MGSRERIRREKGEGTREGGGAARNKHNMPFDVDWARKSEIRPAHILTFCVVSVVCGDEQRVHGSCGGLQQDHRYYHHPPTPQPPPPCRLPP